MPPGTLRGRPGWGEVRWVLRPGEWVNGRPIDVARTSALPHLGRCPGLNQPGPLALATRLAAAGVLPGMDRSDHEPGDSMERPAELFGCDHFIRPEGQRGCGVEGIECRQTVTTRQGQCLLHERLIPVRPAGNRVEERTVEGGLLLPFMEQRLRKNLEPHEVARS